MGVGVGSFVQRAASTKAPLTRTSGPPAHQPPGRSRRTLREQFHATPGQSKTPTPPHLSLFTGH
eukprot:4418398-Prorocentrum_lima.AAC.1